MNNNNNNKKVERKLSFYVLSSVLGMSVVNGAKVPFNFQSTFMVFLYLSSYVIWIPELCATNTGKSKHVV